jgi:hypothetical protein
VAIVRPSELPPDALLRRYRDGGGYADAYLTEVPLAVSQAEFVEAFYTTWLFRLERWVLAVFARRPSTDGDARALADGSRNDFAAWQVEAREPGQLLLTDMLGRTRSWLMCEPVADGRSTRLYFGSAVVPVTDRRTGQRRMGWLFRALLGFHHLYSRALLGAAARRLVRSAKALSEKAA